MCSYCELIETTLTAIFTTCNITAFLYGRYQEEKYFYFKIGVNNNSEAFLNMDCPRCKLQEIKTVIDTMTISALKTVSSCVQGTITILGFAVLLWKKSGEKIGIRE